MSDLMNQEKWYALHTRSNFEKRVATDLELKGIENYYPSFAEVHEWADRKKVIHKPLFPGYVFVHFADSSKTRLRVLETPGTVRILGNSNELVPVPAVEIESIQKLLSSGCPWSPHPFLSEGAWVRVKRGLLKDAEGTLVRLKSSTRLVLSIDLFSKSVATEVNSSDVEVIRPSKARLCSVA